jgi:hypothetical protein
MGECLVTCVSVVLTFGAACILFLQVLITKNVRKIPDKHIMKRWTVDARDILPDHIKHYQKDMGPPEAITFRHSAMYITALELVHMGDTNPDAFECVMSGLCELKQKAVALCDVNDGKSIVEKSRASSLANSVESRQASLGKKKQASADGSGVGASCSSSSFVRGQLLNEDRCEVTSRATVLVEDLLAPERRLKRGLPTTARDKPPYEQNSKRTRFCGICRAAGHKRTTCPQRGDRPVNQRKEPQCSNCGLTGHRKTSCVKPMYSMIPSVQARIE